MFRVYSDCFICLQKRSLEVVVEKLESYFFSYDGLFWRQENTGYDVIDLDLFKAWKLTNITK